MHEALYYEKLDADKVKCVLCPHNCVILPEKIGYCNVRQNNDGRLESLVYGQVSSMAVDPIEKKPLFHFYPGSLVLSLGTIGCNMRCGHCQNWEIAHAAHGSRRTEYMPPEKAVEMALHNDCEGIAWTYNEPTVWFEYTLDSAKLAKKNNLYTVYVTNGYINIEPLDEIGPYLDAFRVDVKGCTDDFYRKVTKVPHMQPVLDSAVRAKKKWNMHVEIVTNIIPKMNDDDEQLRSIAKWIKNELGADTPWHVTRFIPYLEFSEHDPTSLEILERAHAIGMNEGLNHVYIGNVPGNPNESTYCSKCANMVIERQGYEIISFDIEKGKCKICNTPINIRQS